MTTTKPQHRSLPAGWPLRVDGFRDGAAYKINTYDGTVSIWIGSDLYLAEIVGGEFRALGNVPAEILAFAERAVRSAAL